MDGPEIGREGKEGGGGREKENTFTLFTIGNKAIKWMQNIKKLWDCTGKHDSCSQICKDCS